MMARLFIAFLLLLTTLVLADGLSDLNALATTLTANASNISVLSNSTDTNKTNVAASAQSMIDTVSSQLITTRQSVVNAQTAWTNGASSSDLSAPYFSYTSAIRSLANALNTLGKAISIPAPNQQAMINSMNACNDAIHDFGSYLYTHNIITRQAWVSTLSAMGTLTSAESAWSGAANGASSSQSVPAATSSSNGTRRV